MMQSSSTNLAWHLDVTLSTYIKKIFQINQQGSFRIKLVHKFLLLVAREPFPACEQTKRYSGIDRYSVLDFE